jgi:hypothetical protein
MDRKKAEKEISLHLNVLSHMATGKDVDVSVVDDGEGTYCDLGKGKIYIEEVSEDIEILIGLGFHELGHVLATSAIDYAKEFGVPKDEEKAVHRQMNSLEDFRIENRISVLYPPAEYYLKKMARWFRLEYAQKTVLGNMTKSPTYVLHLHLGDIDLTRFVKKAPRTVIKQLNEELREKKFAELPSTRALFPLALDAYNRLKQFSPPGQEGQVPSITSMLEAKQTERNGTKNPGKGNPHPQFENIEGDGSNLGLGKPNKAEGDASLSPASLSPVQAALQFEEKVEEMNEEKNAGEPTEIKRKKPPCVKAQLEYVRPYTPKVDKVTMYKNYDPHGIDKEDFSAEEGKKIGLRLVQELKFKEAERHRLDDGELNVDTVIEKMQENRGRLEDFDVFSDEKPLIHDHTVLVLVDMSGSMGGQDIRVARSAALMLARALDEMNVPYSIRGFGAVSNELVIKDYVIKDFDGALELPKLRSMFMGEQNRDSDSLRHAMELIRSERGKKLIFLISDGRPAHPDGVDDYRTYDNQAFMDMYFLVREAEKEGISVIGIGITDEATEFIAGAYLKGFVINDIKELPEKLVKIYLQESSGMRTWRSCLL